MTAFLKCKRMNYFGAPWIYSQHSGHFVNLMEGTFWRLWRQLATLLFKFFLLWHFWPFPAGIIQRNGKKQINVQKKEPLLGLFAWMSAMVKPFSFSTHERRKIVLQVSHNKAFTDYKSTLNLELKGAVWTASLGRKVKVRGAICLFTLWVKVKIFLGTCFEGWE